MTITVSMTVNGEERSGVCEERTLLVTFLRETLRLTGTHVGCDTSQCGACVVHLDGDSVKACTILAVQAAGARRDDNRGDCRRRHAPSHAAGLSRESRSAVRLLHPGHDHERPRSSETQPLADRARDQGPSRGQLLPLHRLPQHRPVDRRRGRHDGARGGLETRVRLPLPPRRVDR